MLINWLKKVYFTKNIFCRKQGVLGNCNDDVILRENHVTIPSYCHECVYEVSRYLWCKFQVNTINTTVMKYQPRAKMAPPELCWTKIAQTFNRVTLMSLLSQSFVKLCLNPFVPNALFLHPLKTSKNLTVFWYFQGVEKGCMGNKWVNFGILYC